MIRISWLVGAILAAGPLDLGATLPVGIMDARLVGTGGDPRALSNYRGKPVVLFYEGRGTTEVNRELKTQLFARGKERGLLDGAWVVPVASLESYNWPPARTFALAAVRAAEAKVGIPLLIDWEGTLTRSPWNLPADNSSVVLLDARGVKVFERSGRLLQPEIDHLFELLETMIPSAHPPAATPPVAAPASGG
jgi:hypothetical protein